MVTKNDDPAGGNREVDALLAVAALLLAEPKELDIKINNDMHYV